MVFMFVGCGTYKGGTLTEGNVIQAGIKVPTSSSISLQVLNYIDGMVLQWEDDVDIEINRTTSSESHALGMFDTTTTNSTSITIHKKEKN